MKIVSRHPVKLSPVVSMPDPQQYQLTMVVKAVFDLHQNGVAALAEEQDIPSGDVPFPDATSPDSHRKDSDLAPFKPRADLLLAGHCHVPGSSAVKKCPVSFQLGEHHAKAMVFGDRQWRHRLGMFPTITEPTPFTKMELRYENAFGGEGFKFNPIGKGMKPTKSESDELIHWLPNIEDPDNLVQTPDSRPNPVGFGPLAMFWQDRFAHIGTYDKKWKATRWPCFPTDFDWRFFNAAPPNMQIDGYLRGDEELTCENLHAVHPSFTTRLPGLRVRCFTNEVDEKDPNDRNFDQVPMNLDTVFVDMDEETVALTWRGKRPIRTDDYREIEHIYLVVEKLSEPESPLDVYRNAFELELTSEDAEVEIPDMEADVAARIAAAVDPAAVDRHVNAVMGNIGVSFPSDLASMSLTGQLAALSNFSDEMSIAATAYVDRELAKQKSKMLDAGVDLDDRPQELQEQDQKKSAEMLASVGLDSDLQDLDSDLKQLGKDLAESGVDTSQLTIGPEQLSGGLAGVLMSQGHSVAALGIAIGTPLVLLTRALITKKLADDQDCNGAMIAGQDLSGMDLRGAKLQGAVLNRTSLKDADLTGADLTGAILIDADLSNAKLSSATLDQVKANRAKFDGADLTDASLQGGTFDTASCIHANFTQADLTDADFTNANLTSADLTKAKLDHTEFGTAQADNSVFDGATGTGTNFVETALTKASFSQCELVNADFSQATIRQASFRQSNLGEASFNAADAEQTDFTATNLTKVRAIQGCNATRAIFHQAIAPNSIWSGATLIGADLTYAQFAEAMLNDANLSDADLTAANMKKARFSKAVLQRAKMIDMNLFQAVLDLADLTEADLTRSNLFGAELFDAILEETKLTDANIGMTKLVTLS